MIRADIINIIEKGNKAIIKYEIREGYEHEIENKLPILEGQPTTITVFETTSVLKNSNCVFNYFPVPEDDIKIFLQSEIENIQLT